MNPACFAAHASGSCLPGPGFGGSQPLRSRSLPASLQAPTHFLPGHKRFPQEGQHAGSRIRRTGILRLFVANGVLFRLRHTVLGGLRRQPPPKQDGALLFDATASADVPPFAAASAPLARYPPCIHWPARRARLQSRLARLIAQPDFASLPAPAATIPQGNTEPSAGGPGPRQSRGWSGTRSPPQHRPSPVWPPPAAVGLRGSYVG